MSYVCPACGTKVIELYEEGDCSYTQNLLAKKLEEYMDFDDHRNIGYTWYCTDKSCNAGSGGWPGDRTECPPYVKEASQ